jgi:hypothetical protein
MAKSCESFVASDTRVFIFTDESPYTAICIDDKQFQRHVKRKNGKITLDIKEESIVIMPSKYNTFVVQKNRNGRLAVSPIPRKVFVNKYKIAEEYDWTKIQFSQEDYVDFDETEELGSKIHTLQMDGDGDQEMG